MEETGTGTIRISDDVVATIAGLAATDTPGIAGMSGDQRGTGSPPQRKARKQRGIRGSRRNGSGDRSAGHREHGAKIHEVCRDLQENVRDAVQNMTGLTVVEVNVKVEGVAFPEEPAPEAPKNRVK